ncbi:MAG: hypothetical protein K2Q22_13285, partial [Cytophagales bacterium]|nr:hypothetical protein [Cytophagales bacterium]
LKVLSDERLRQYRELIQNCWDENEEDEITLGYIKMAFFLYTRFISIFEKPDIISMDSNTGGEWIQNMQQLIVFEEMRRNGVFSDVQGSLIGDEFIIKPGENCEDSREFFLNPITVVN